MYTRRCLILVPVLLASVALMGLASLLPETTNAARTIERTNSYEPVTITHWHHNTGIRADHLDTLIAEFNATNPYSITVTDQYVGGFTDIYNEVITRIQNGRDLPNVVVGYPNMFADFARYGSVRFLDDYLDDPVVGITDTADFFPGVLDNYRLGEYGNQLAGIQNGRSIEVMYYNADLLSAAGLTVPETWDAFETACMSITNNAVDGAIIDTDASRFTNWLWSRGGELLSSDLNHARFDEQPGIDSLTLFQRLIENGYARLPTFAFEGQEAFGNGQVGFTFGSSAGIPYYRQSIENGANDMWGVAHVPAISGNEVVDSYGAGQGILHNDETADRAAWLFIKWLAEREQTARWAALTGYFPVRISAETHVSMTDKLALDVQYAQAYDLLPLGKSEPGIRGYNDIRHTVEMAVIDVLGNGANVTTTLQSAAGEVEAILAASGPDSATIPPSGGTLTYSSTQGISATIQFPTGALLVTETVSYVPLADLPTDGLAFALAPNLAFSQPVTITLQYQDTDIEGMDEDGLQFYNYDWSTNSWVAANPCGGYIRYPEQNILQAGVCHFSDYGLLDWLYTIYLPTVLNPNS